MLMTSKNLRKASLTLIAALAMSAPLAVSAQSAMPQAPMTPTGSVKGSMGSISWVVGLRFGEGMLAGMGEARKFRIGGLSILSAGVAGGNFKGKVYNLVNPEDFEGTYTFAEIGGAYGVGGGVQRWMNKKGVIIEVYGLEVGVELRAGPGALKVSYVK